MSKKNLSQFIATPELKEFYKQLGVWLRENNIPHKKLAIGFSISLTDIPKDKVADWLEVSSFDNWRKKSK